MIWLSVFLTLSNFKERKLPTTTQMAPIIVVAAKHNFEKTVCKNIQNRRELKF